MLSLSVPLSTEISMQSLMCEALSYYESGQFKVNRKRGKEEGEKGRMRE